MPVPTFDLFRAIQVAIFVVGLVIVYYSYRGYKRTGNKSLLYLAIGFVFIALGSAAAGLLFEILNYNLETVETIEAGFRLVGFLLIVYSIIGSRS